MDMRDNMSPLQLPLTLIVAATTKNGIGKNGGLPWPMLKKEMAYFARVTKRVPTSTHTGSAQADTSKSTGLDTKRRNVVIMGRKTWESIPPKFRPLKDRTNVVISSQDRSTLGEVPDDVVVATNIISALKALEAAVQEGKAPSVGRAFIIGGSSIYQAALEMEQTKAVLLTRIQKDYDCDTFFPVELEGGSDGWQREGRAKLQEFIEEDVAAEGMSESHGDEEVRYEFQLYRRS